MDDDHRRDAGEVGVEASLNGLSVSRMGSADTEQPTVRGDGRLRVLTLNIWNRQGPWEKRLALIRRGLAALAPDVVGLQEVLRHEAIPPDQVEEIAAGLGYHFAYGPAWHIGGGLHFGNAVLSRWPIAASKQFSLPCDEGEEQRSLLHCEIDAPFGRLPLFVTHLDWKFHQSAIRCRQVSYIADRVAELAPRNHAMFPPILVGDFNAEPDADEIRFLVGYRPLYGRSVFFADCQRVAGGGGSGATFCRRNPYAAQAREPDRRIDYVFVRGPDRDGRGEPLSCRVVFDEPEGNVWPTDHFGVLAEVSVTPVPLPPIE